MTDWTCVLALDQGRATVSGSEQALCDAIRNGADLRISTEFRHNEHIDTASDNNELIRETAEFGITYLLDNRWTAGIMSLRQPISLPDGFGPRPSMSFFMYNQNGQQAIARPFLDGVPPTEKPESSSPDDVADMPRYHQQDAWDDGTNAPSSNFIYDFDVFRFWVRDDWRAVLSHGEDGTVLSGSVDDLADAAARGQEVKVGVRGPCEDLAVGTDEGVAHEVFVQTGSCYHYTDRNLFMAGTHPLVRVRPAIPMEYGSNAWDFGWLMCRTDGHTARLLYDPYTLKPRRSEGRYSIRWFTR